MSKLPKIYHSNDKVISNNMNCYMNSKKEEKQEIEENKEIEYINYFNKNIEVILKDNSSISGILVSVQKDYILLNNGHYIDIKDILYIK